MLRKNQAVAVYPFSFMSKNAPTGAMPLPPAMNRTGAEAFESLKVAVRSGKVKRFAFLQMVKDPCRANARGNFSNHEVDMFLSEGLDAIEKLRNTASLPP